MNGGEKVVFVSRVLPDSSASANGVVEGSVLLSIDNKICISQEMAVQEFENSSRPLKIRFKSPDHQRIQRIGVTTSISSEENTK